MTRGGYELDDIELVLRVIHPIHQAMTHHCSYQIPLHRRKPVPRAKVDPGLGGCNPIGIDEHGHDFDMSLSRCPGESRDPCFHKH
jgi:hypothetical protein